MVNDRPYHKVISKEKAFIELRRCLETQFDKKVVDIYDFNILEIL